MVEYPINTIYEFLSHTSAPRNTSVGYISWNVDQVECVLSDWYECKRSQHSNLRAKTYTSWTAWGIPQAPNCLGRVWFIAWRLRCLILEECRLSSSQFRSCSGPMLRGACATVWNGGMPNKYEEFNHGLAGTLLVWTDSVIFCTKLYFLFNLKISLGRKYLFFFKCSFSLSGYIHGSVIST